MKVLKTGNINKACSSYAELAKLESAKGNFQQANHYWEKAIEFSDSIYRISQTESLVKINSLYNYQHTEKKNAQLILEKEKQEFWTLFFIAISICSIALGVTINLYQKRKKEKILTKIEEKKKQDEQKYKSSLDAIKDNLLKIAELDKLLQKKDIENDLLQLKLAEVQKEKLKAQNEAIKQWKEEQKLRLMTFKNSEVYQELLQASKDETYNMTPMKHPGKWMTIQEHIDSIYPDFTDRLHKLCPTLSDRDLQVCYLTKLGMSPSDISRVLKQSRQAITNIRKRIMQKIEQITPKSSNFDHFIEDF